MKRRNSADTWEKAAFYLNKLDVTRGELNLRDRNCFYLCWSGESTPVDGEMLHIVFELWCVSINPATKIRKMIFVFDWIKLGLMRIPIDQDNRVADGLYIIVWDDRFGKVC